VAGIVVTAFSLVEGESVPVVMTVAVSLKLS
jgi:hypothetical protein